MSRGTHRTGIKALLLSPLFILATTSFADEECSDYDYSNKINCEGCCNATCEWYGQYSEDPWKCRNKSTWTIIRDHCFAINALLCSPWVLHHSVKTNKNKEPHCRPQGTKQDHYKQDFLIGLSSLDEPSFSSRSLLLGWEGPIISFSFCSCLPNKPLWHGCIFCIFSLFGEPSLNRSIRNGFLCFEE